MKVLLVGVGCVGKTTIGRVLAARLGYPFLDLDDHCKDDRRAAGAVPHGEADRYQDSRLRPDLPVADRNIESRDSLQEGGVSKRYGPGKLQWALGLGAGVDRWDSVGLGAARDVAEQRTAPVERALGQFAPAMGAVFAGNPRSPSCRLAATVQTEAGESAGSHAQSQEKNPQATQLRTASYR